MTNKIWDMPTITQLFEMPFLALIFKAQTIHQAHFPENKIQLSSLLSIKTGACPEDCAYCPQSGHYNTGLEKEKLMPLAVVIEKATAAKEKGATRFCMGAAWKYPPKKELPKVIEMIKAVKSLGLESCVTLGTLDKEDSANLKEAGLDYYNHNLDTSPEHYKNIITTRSYQERLDTLEHIRKAGIKTCCGGILGLGETRKDRVKFLLELINLPQPPESVPINALIPIPGTPLENAEKIDNFEFIKTIAVARITLPTSKIRLSAGREDMNDEMQTLCFMAGANSIFYGGKLLTSANPEEDKDIRLLNKLGLNIENFTCEKSTV